MNAPIAKNQRFVFDVAQLEGEVPLAVSLERWAPCVRHQRRFAELHEAALQAGAATFAPMPGLPGFSRQWIVLSGASPDDWLATNGYLTVAAAGRHETAVEALGALLDTRSLPFLAERHVGPLPPRLLFAQTMPVRDTLRLLALWTAAILVLDDLAHLPVQRNPVVRWFRYFGGCAVEVITMLRGSDEHRVSRTGFLRRVYVSSTPDQRHVAERFLRSVIKPASDEAERQRHPAAALMAPLEHLTSERDDGEIADERMQRVRRATVAGASLGALVGATIPNAITEGGGKGLMVLGGLVALWLGFALVLLVRDAATERRSQRRIRGLADRAGRSQGPPLARVTRRILRGPARVLVGRRMGVVDFACAVVLWTELLARHHATLTPDTDLEAGVPTVVVGGPLVRPPVSARPLCDIELTHATYDGWSYVADQQHLCRAGFDDSVGCVSVDATGDLLFVNGFRDCRAALRWVIGDLDDPAGADGADGPWALVRGGIHASR